MKRKPTEFAWWAIVLMLVSVCFILNSPNLFAGRGVLSIGNALAQNMTVVLATIEDVKEVDSGEVDSLGNKITGYSFRLDFVEVIRLGQMNANVKKFDVAFSSNRHGSNWDPGSKPINGMKAMVHLKPVKLGVFELHSHDGGILVL